MGVAKTELSEKVPWKNSQETYRGKKLLISVTLNMIIHTCSTLAV